MADITKANSLSTKDLAIPLSIAAVPQSHKKSAELVETCPPQPKHMLADELDHRDFANLELMLTQPGLTQRERAELIGISRQALGERERRELFKQELIRIRTSGVIRAAAQAPKTLLTVMVNGDEKNKTSAALGILKELRELERMKRGLPPSDHDGGTQIQVTIGSVMNIINALPAEEQNKIKSISQRDFHRLVRSTEKDDPNVVETLSEPSESQKEQA